MTQINKLKKENKSIETIIGFLLLVPIYIVVFFLLKVININVNTDILLPIILYIPIIVGIILSYIFEGKKSCIILSLLIFVFCFVSFSFYYDTYFVQHSNFDAIGSYIFWIATTLICRILSVIFYGKIVKWKKASIFVCISIAVYIFALCIGFWE